MLKHTKNRGLREQQQDESYLNFGQQQPTRASLANLSQEQRNTGQMRFVPEVEGLYYFDGEGWEQCSAINIDLSFTPVVDIDMPTEIFGTLPRSLSGEVEDSTDIIAAVQAREDLLDWVTIYRFQGPDSFSFEPEDLGPLSGQTKYSPYVMEIDGGVGYWVAAGGRYVYGNGNLKGPLATATMPGGLADLLVKSFSDKAASGLRYDVDTASPNVGQNRFLPFSRLGQTRRMMVSQANHVFPSSNGTTTLTAINFGDVTVGNTGIFDIRLVAPAGGNSKLYAAVFVGNTGDQFGKTTTTPILIPGNAEMPLQISFVPTSPGSKTCTLRLLSDSSTQHKYDIQLTGNGV